MPLLCVVCGEAKQPGTSYGAEVCKNCQSFEKFRQIDEIFESGIDFFP